MTHLTSIFNSETVSSSMNENSFVHVTRNNKYIHTGGKTDYGTYMGCFPQEVQKNL